MKVTYWACQVIVPDWDGTLYVVWQSATYINGRASCIADRDTYQRALRRRLFKTYEERMAFLDTVPQTPAEIRRCKALKRS